MSLNHGTLRIPFFAQVFHMRFVRYNPKGFTQRMIFHQPVYREAWLVTYVLCGSSQTALKGSFQASSAGMPWVTTASR